ncbi:MAG: TolC family protein, partial [Candidatus Neomarinimicrobiota bacterium]|nr:TolC family protein [Candidatus Neomarinimicrobiota bacterium]
AKIIHDLYSERYKTGIIKSNFFQQSEMILNNAQSDLDNKTSVLNGLIRQGKVLIREYPDLTLVISNDFPEYLPSIPIVLPADIIKRRPDLIASQYDMLAAKALNKQAMRAMYPTFSLTSGSPASSSNDLEDLLEEDFKVWNQGLTIFAPIFSAGKLIASKRIAKNQKEIAMLQFINDLLNAYKEVESNLQFDNTALSSLALVNKNVKIAESIYNTTLNEFYEGIASAEDVINANNMLFDTKNILATTEKIRIEQRINLILSLGGGFAYE